MTERRHSFRIPLRAVASLRAPGVGHRCDVDDLSLGGAHLTHAPRLSAGEPVHLDIRVPGFTTVSAHGDAVRSGEGWASVRFSQLDANAEDTIHDLSVAMLEHGARPALLIVACGGDLRDQLVEAARDTGYDIVTACTPLETLAALSDPLLDIGAALIDLDLTQTTGLEVLRYLAAEHPYIVRIAVARARDRGLTDRAEAAGLAHDVLCEPVDMSGVTSTMRTVRLEYGREP